MSADGSVHLKTEELTESNGRSLSAGADTTEGKDQKKLFNPLFLFSSAWDFVVTMLLISTLITMPLSLGFKTIEVRGEEGTRAARAHDEFCLRDIHPPTPRTSPWTSRMRCSVGTSSLTSASCQIG